MFLEHIVIIIVTIWASLFIETIQYNGQVEYRKHASRTAS